MENRVSLAHWRAETTRPRTTTGRYFALASMPLVYHQNSLKFRKSGCLPVVAVKCALYVEKDLSPDGPCETYKQFLSGSADRVRQEVQFSALQQHIYIPETTQTPREDRF
jgi:hypothetical protein